MSQKVDLQALLSSCKTIDISREVASAMKENRWKRQTYRDETTGMLVTKIGRKAHRNQFGLLRKMFAGCIASPDGSFYWFGDGEMNGTSEKVIRYRKVRFSEAEAEGPNAELARAIGRLIGVGVRVNHRGEYLEAVLSHTHLDEKVQDFIEICDVVMLSVVRSSNGVLIRDHTFDVEAKWVPPSVCPLIDAINREDMSRLSPFVRLKTMKREVAKPSTTKPRKELGPSDFPRDIKVSWYYTNSEIDELVREDGTRVRTNQNPVLMNVTWAEYCRWQDVRQKYRVDQRTKKRRKGKSKGGNGGGGPAFTHKSHSNVVKHAMRFADRGVK